MIGTTSVLLLEVHIDLVSVDGWVEFGFLSALRILKLSNLFFEIRNFCTIKFRDFSSQKSVLVELVLGEDGLPESGSDLVTALSDLQADARPRFSSRLSVYRHFGFRSGANRSENAEV